MSPFITSCHRDCSVPPPIARYQLCFPLLPSPKRGLFGQHLQNHFQVRSVWDQSGRPISDQAPCLSLRSSPWESCSKFNFSVLVLPVVLGNIQAVALRDIFVQAQNRDSSPPSLQIEEPEWEKRRSINLSELIDIYRQGRHLTLSLTSPDLSHAMESLSLVGLVNMCVEFEGETVLALICYFLIWLI